MWLDLEASLDRLLRQQAGGQQHARVAGVGATGDGRDQHVAIADGEVAARRLCRRARALGPVVHHFRHIARRALGRGWRLRHRRLAVVGMETGVQQFGRAVEAVLRIGFAEQLGKLARDLAELDAVLRALRASQAGRDQAEVELDHLRILDLARGLRCAGSAGHAEQALRTEIGFERLDLCLAAARAAEVVERFFVDREEAHGGTVLGRHVGDGGAVGQGQ